VLLVLVLVLLLVEVCLGVLVVVRDVFVCICVGVLVLVMVDVSVVVAVTVVVVVPVMEKVDADVIDVTVVPSQNDSSEGLANMYRDLAPAADRLRASAFSLLLLSFFFCGTLEGMFGLIAAASVLCCAAPGSLGTAYAARCTRIAAIVCAALALGEILMLGTLSMMVPHVPEAVQKMCDGVPPPPAAHLAAAPQQHHAEPPAHAPMRTYELEFEALTIPATAKEGAHTFVAIAVAGARRLQAVAPSSVALTPDEVKCARAQAFATDVLPYLVVLGMFAEFCLFAVAMTTARRALDLVLLARRSGANAL